MSDDEDFQPEKFMLVPTGDLDSIDIGSGPEYDQLLKAEAERYKVGEFIENRPITEVMI